MFVHAKPPRLFLFQSTPNGAELKIQVGSNCCAAHAAVARDGYANQRLHHLQARVVFEFVIVRRRLVAVDDTYLDVIIVAKINNLGRAELLAFT